MEELCCQKLQGKVTQDLIYNPASVHIRYWSFVVPPPPWSSLCRRPKAYALGAHCFKLFAPILSAGRPTTAEDMGCHSRSWVSTLP